MRRTVPAGARAGTALRAAGGDANCAPSMTCGRATMVPSVSNFTIGHIGGIMGHQAMYATRVQCW